MNKEDDHKVLYESISAEEELLHETLSYLYITAKKKNKQNLQITNSSEARGVETIFIQDRMHIETTC